MLSRVKDGMIESIASGAELTTDALSQEHKSVVATKNANSKREES